MKFIRNCRDHASFGQARGEVNCLFGDCQSPSEAAPIPAAVPEPETYVLLLAGLGLMAWQCAVASMMELDSTDSS